MPDDRDLRPDTELFGGFGAQRVPERPEPTARPEPRRDETGPAARNSSDSDLDRNSDSNSDSRFGSKSGSSRPDGAEPPESVKPSVHDPRGLELARALAGRLKGMKPNGPVKPVRRTRRRRTTEPGNSSARPDERDPQMLTSTIGRLMRDQGWEVDVAVHGVMARWPSIVGTEMAQHCRPESYTDTELTVRTDSTAWATQVRLLAPELVRRLNAVLGDDTVTRVVVQGPNAPSWRRGPRTVRGGRGPRDTYG